MKEKETKQQELAKRKYKIPSHLTTWFYNLVMQKFSGRNWGTHLKITDDINKCDGPCFLIWNHLSRLDHAYLTALCYPRPINIVAGYNEFFRSHLHWAFKHQQILPKKVFCTDINGIRAINSIIRQGGVVALSPEGTSSIYGSNQPIVPGTGKFIKHFRIPVYYVEMRGQYLLSTKCCLDNRYAETFAELKLLFTPEDLEKMTDEEVQDKINLVFKHDEYEWQKEHHYRFKTKGNMAQGLETLCYKCPRCGEELKMTAVGNILKCEACGNGLTIDDYYDFHALDNTCVFPESPTKWVLYERQGIIKEIRENENFSFTEDVTIGCLPKYHWVKKEDTGEYCGEGKLTFDHAGIHYKGSNTAGPSEFDLSYKEVFSFCVMTDTTKFAIFVNEEYLEFIPKHPSFMKCMLITEEMHRLHFNEWKNFPWLDYLYEN